jgi:hypothetical protein
VEQGDLWFKEAAPALSFEPTLTLAVAKRFPNVTPEVVVAEGRRMLTLDAGTQLRRLTKTNQRACWEKLLPLYAEAQIALIEDAQDLIALGTPDQRPDELLVAYPRLRGLQSLVGELSGSIPSTLIHQEVTGGNIFADESLHMRILDWAEATISHPFAGLVNTFRDIAYSMRLKPNGREVIRLRATYLEPWTPFASMSELNRLFERGYLLGMLCRAEVWRRIMATQSSRAKYGSYARIWLQFFRQASTIGVAVGGPS